MKRTMSRLMKLNEWKMNEARLSIHHLNTQEQKLDHLSCQVEDFIHKEMIILIQSADLHPIVPQFLRNITLHKKNIVQKKEQIAKNREEIWTALQDIYNDQKKMEKVLQTISEEDYLKTLSEEQKLMDDLYQNQKRRRPREPQQKEP